MNKRTYLTIIIISLLSSKTIAIETIIPYVNDFVGLLNDNQILELNRFATEIDNKTSVEIAIVTLDTVNGAEPLDYAQELGDTNGVGKEGVDNGIIILWVNDIKRGSIATASGIRGTLSDSAVISIGKANRHYFDEGNYYDGIRGMMEAIFNVIIPKEVITNNGAVETSTTTTVDMVSTSGLFQMGSLTNLSIRLMALCIVIIVVSFFFSILKGSSTESHYEVEDEEEERLTKAQKKRLAKKLGKKLPKRLPKKFMRKYKIIKKERQYYQVRSNNSHYCCSNVLLLHYWNYWVLFSVMHGYHHNSHYIPRTHYEQVVNKTTTTSSTSNSSSSSTPTTSYSSPAFSGGSFGGGGGFSGGGSSGGGGGGF